MPSQKFTFQVQTDINGYFMHSSKIDPPGWWELNVDLTANLLEPAETTVNGILDIDADDGNPSNSEKKFIIRQGEEISLGTWRLDGGKNTIVIHGRTLPIASNSTVSVEVTASV